MPHTIPSALLIILYTLLCSAASAQTMTLATSSNGYIKSPLFSDVQTFNINIDINEALERRAYNNPVISHVSYQVSGTLE